MSGTLTSSECALSRRRPISASSGVWLHSLLDDAEPTGLDTPRSGHRAATSPSGRSAAVGSRSCRGTAWVIVSRRTAFRTAPIFGRCGWPVSAGLWPCRRVGSLRTDLPPGSLVIPDQILDRTSGRAHTRTWTPTTGCFTRRVRRSVLVRSAEPAAPAAGMRATGLPVQPAATMVAVNGPRFSTRAESQEFQPSRSRDHRHDRHAGRARPGTRPVLHDAHSVTDLDAGIEIGSGLPPDRGVRAVRGQRARLRTLLVATIEQLPPGQTEPCECGRVTTRSRRRSSCRERWRRGHRCGPRRSPVGTWSVTWPLRSGWASVSRTFRPTHRSTTTALPSVRVRRCRSRDLPRGGAGRRAPAPNSRRRALGRYRETHREPASPGNVVHVHAAAMSLDDAAR